MGLYDTYIGLIWVYQLITLPLVLWIVRGYFEGDLAVLDGGGGDPGASIGRVR